MVNENLAAIAAELPDVRVAHGSNVPLHICQGSAPTVFPARRFPEAICFGRVPRRHVHSVSYMRHGHFCLRPPWKQNLENSSADLTVQFTDPVDGAAAPDRQVGHIERFGRILANPPTQCQKLIEGNRKALLSVLPQIALDQLGGEAVEACLYGSVGSKKVTGTSDCKRNIEFLTAIFHVGKRPLQYRECGVTFIEMANLGP